MMKKEIEQLTDLINTFRSNDKLLVSVAEVQPGYSNDDLIGLENIIDMKFGEQVKEFYSLVSEISFSWSVKPTYLSAIAEDERGYLGGSIQILNPFDMIMGKKGMKWKDELWFDEMNEEEKKSFKSFAPFDFPTTELITGFKLTDKNITGEMMLLNINEGIKPFSTGLNDYIMYLIKTKGYYYWQKFTDDKNSLEFNSFINNMPKFFNDFDVNFFKK